MPKDFLLRRQRLALVRAIAEVGMSPADFADGFWAPDLLGFSPRVVGDRWGVVYKPNGQYSFAVHPDGYDFAVLMRPGSESAVEGQGQLQWDGVLNMFRIWVSSLKEELPLPSQWHELASLHATTRIPGASDNAPFSQEDQTYLHAQLDRILAAVHFTQDQLTVVTADVDYLKEATARSGRRDWVLQLVGTVGSWLLGSVLPPDQLAEIVRDHVVPLVQILTQRALRP